MRPFVHWTLAWTSCFAVTLVIIVVIAAVRGQLDPRWQSVLGAIQGGALLVSVAAIGGAAMAGITAVFPEPREPPREINNPIVRLTLLPVVVTAAILLLWMLGVR